VPPAAFQVLPGKGSVVGTELVEDPRLGGMTFTGSYAVGMGIYRSFTQDYPRPVICEMGGKNPVIVTAKADLEKAAEGIKRSAFGFGGQKCSAASRAYVEAGVHDELMSMLIEKTSAIRIGNPLERDVWLGPVIDEKAVGRFEEAVAEARASGEVLFGGERLTEGDLARGNFVQPTIVKAPRESWLWKRELFVPFIAVDAVGSLDEALRLANDTEYGLTAGLFSEDRGEIDRFLAGIEAGVVYVNRRAGATTGAWPGVQPFGGWKGSGTSGKAGGGDYYVQQFMREQSQTLVDA
jgi:1-pyrroline-5-carboxylate dehydrogenase